MSWISQRCWFNQSQSQSNSGHWSWGKLHWVAVLCILPHINVLEAWNILTPLGKDPPRPIQTSSFCWFWFESIGYNKAATISTAHPWILQGILSCVWTWEAARIPEFGAPGRGALKPHKLDTHIWSERHVDGVWSHSIYPALNFLLNSRLLDSSTQLTTWKSPKIWIESNAEHFVSMATCLFPRLSISANCPAMHLSLQIQIWNIPGDSFTHVPSLHEYCYCAYSDFTWLIANLPAYKHFLSFPSSSKPTIPISELTL